jgi:glyoxylase-like metal-dependent hydrolase (beta-lactamase superfamily II)
MVKGKQPGPPRITFSREMSVRLGGKEARMIHLGRGHTDGDAVVLFAAHRIVATGDMFVAGAPFADYANGGSAVEWPNTINQVLHLEFDRAVPGHGPISTKADMAKWNEAFGVVHKQVSEWKRQGKTKEEVTAAFAAGEGVPWKSWRSIAGYYDELSQ